MYIICPLGQILAKCAYLEKFLGLRNICYYSHSSLKKKKKALEFLAYVF